MSALPEPREVTALLRDWSSGDRRALERLMPLVYDELRRLAASYLRAERPDHTLQPGPHPRAYLAVDQFVSVVRSLLLVAARVCATSQAASVMGGRVRLPRDGDPPSRYPPTMTGAARWTPRCWTLQSSTLVRRGSSSCVSSPD